MVTGYKLRVSGCFMLRVAGCFRIVTGCKVTSCYKLLACLIDLFRFDPPLSGICNSASCSHWQASLTQKDPFWSLFWIIRVND